MIILIYNRLLVIAVRLVASLKLGQMINITAAVVIPLDNNLVRCGTLNHTCVLCHYAHARVNSCLCLNTGSYNRSLCAEQRYGLTLHVRSHQRTVCVIVLQERNHGGCHGEYHLRGNVHQINRLLLEFRSLLTETSGNVIVNEVTFLIQRFVCLCNNEVILFICCQINHIICNNRIHRVCLIDNSVRSLNKAVLIDSCIGCQRVDQTDVGSLRSLDRTHTSVMGVVYVSHLESGTISGQTARSQSGQTSLVGQLSQRVILIHKLRQLGASKELLHCCSDRFNIDQGLGRDAVHILSCHTFSYHTLHTGQTDTILVLKQLANGTDTTVAQMVNIICIADLAFQMHIIVDGSNDIFLCNMLGNQLADIAVNQNL